MQLGGGLWWNVKSPENDDADTSHNVGGQRVVASNPVARWAMSLEFSRSMERRGRTRRAYSLESVRCQSQDRQDNGPGAVEARGSAFGGRKDSNYYADRKRTAVVCQHKSSRVVEEEEEVVVVVREPILS